MRSVVVPVVVVIALAIIVVLHRQSERRRARLDRDDLRQLRRIYRRDNPRGAGLDPLIHDQQRSRLRLRPKDR